MRCRCAKIKLLDGHEGLLTRLWASLAAINSASQIPASTTSAARRQTVIPGVTITNLVKSTHRVAQRDRQSVVDFDIYRGASFEVSMPGRNEDMRGE